MSSGNEESSGQSADALLRQRVHPPDWQNPEPASQYHLVVIGGGTAGLVAAAGAAGLGARVALVERDLLGGDCLNTGCVPSKALIASGRSWQSARTATEFGGPTVAGAGDGAAAFRRMRELRAAISVADSAERFRGLGVDVYFGEARFVGRDAVAVGETILRFRKAVIATGSRPTVPEIPGLSAVGLHTSATIFALDAPPPGLVIVGAGPVGCELAQAFRRLGSVVTLVEQQGSILPGDDPEAAAVVMAALLREGVDVRVGCRLARVNRRPDGQVVAYLVGDGMAGQVEATDLLVAAGRQPRLEQLGLAAAGIEVGNGELLVNDRLRTTNRRVYAAGDVIGPYRFTHAADAQARLVIGNALFHGRARASRLVVPWCTYTSPEVAQVGVTGASARAQGLAVQTITVPFAENDRAVLDGDTAGFLRVHLRRGSDQIVGATVVGAQAGELIGEAVMAMQRRIGLGALGQVVRPYPTLSLSWRRAADQWRRGKLTPTVHRVLGWWFWGGR